MEITQIRSLRGPNVWGCCAALEVQLEKSAGNVPIGEPAWAKLRQWIPQLPTDSTAPISLQHFAVELQRLAGAKLEITASDLPPASSDECLVAVPYDEETLARECVLAAARLIDAAGKNQPIDFQALLAPLRELADQHCLGPSTRAIVEAALRRGIPIQRMNRGSFVQLGQGARQRRIRTAETDQTSAIAESICENKDLTKRLLSAVGVPVPEGRLVEDRDDAWVAAEEIGLPVVVKPKDGNHGRGVFTNLTTKEMVQRAYDAAVPEGSGVMVEQFAPGCEHRLLVVGNRVVAATGGKPAYITGDGVQTVEQLIEEQLNSDPRRGEDYDTPLSKIEYDPVTLLVLEQQGLTPKSVAPGGQSVLVQRNGNLAYDVTDRLHPDVAARAVDAARVVGLDVAGVDLVAEDVSVPLESQRGMIVEVNAGPGLQMHLSPMEGKPRPVGDAIVANLFPAEETGRIPVIAMLGAEHDSPVCKLLVRLLRGKFQYVGVAGQGAIVVNGRKVVGSSDPAMLLMNPMVEAAVFALQPDDVRASGLPFDRCQVSVLFRATASARGDGSTSAVCRVLCESLLDGGQVVVAGEPSEPRSGCAAAASLLLVNEKLDSSVEQHVQAGGTACTNVEDSIYLLRPGDRMRVCDVAVLQSSGASLLEALVAVAAAAAAGLSPAAIQAGLGAPAAGPT